MGQGATGSGCCLAQDKSPDVLTASAASSTSAAAARVIAEAEAAAASSPSGFPDPDVSQPDMEAVNAALTAVSESISRITENRPLPEAPSEASAEGREEELEAALSAAKARIARLEEELAASVQPLREMPTAGEPGSVRALATGFDAAARAAESQRAKDAAAERVRWERSPLHRMGVADPRSPPTTPSKFYRGDGRFSVARQVASPTTLAQMTFGQESHGHSRRTAVRGWGCGSSEFARSPSSSVWTSPGKENQREGENSLLSKRRTIASSAVDRKPLRAVELDWSTVLGGQRPVASKPGDRATLSWDAPPVGLV
jgi:hypothetical protein